jgi:alcohol dehydrogenase (NADP+)
MIDSAGFRTKTIALNHGAGRIPVIGFGALIPDTAATISATRDALEAGFRHFDCAEPYRNEREVGEALQVGLVGGGIAREGIFVAAKLWNTNHRPERVEPAFEASLERLGLNYLDLYLIHTPFAFQPGDEHDPRDQNGNILYDRGVTLLKPAVVQVEAHPYLPETELLEFCKKNGIVFLAFAPLGHGIKPGPLEDPVISAIAVRVAVLTTPRSANRARENFNISAPSARRTRRNQSNSD